MVDWYILDENKQPRKVDNFMEYALWSQDINNKIVEQTDIGNVKVSTVFLGLDHSFVKGVVILFETMVFGGKLDQDMQRYQTWSEAIRGHKSICKKILKTFSIEADELQKVIIERLN
jgi:hypothetical protein